MRKKFVAAVAALIILSGFAVLGSSPTVVENLLNSLTGQSFASVYSPSREAADVRDRKETPLRPVRSPNALSGQQSIPDHVLYDTVFRMDASVRAQAEQQEGNGEVPTAFRYYFRNEVGLTPAEDEILRQVAKEFVEEIQPIDGNAESVVTSNAKASQKRVSLTQLQEQRDAVVLANRDKLAGRLGATFTQFNQFVQGPFAVNLRSYEMPAN